VKLTVVTSNRYKAEEVAAFFWGILDVEHIDLECPEYRHDDVGEIARQKAEYAFNALKKPLIVDDTGLYINALNGFPGPYASYVFHTIGNEGIGALLKEKSDKTAYFETAVAYAEEGGIRVFTGRLEGMIVAPRGSGGFGYDPIFEWGDMTLAELPLTEKCVISHRARALLAFRDWIVSAR